MTCAFIYMHPRQSTPVPSPFFGPLSPTLVPSMPLVGNSPAMAAFGSPVIAPIGTPRSSSSSASVLNGIQPLPLSPAHSGHANNANNANGACKCEAVCVYQLKLVYVR